MTYIDIIFVIPLAWFAFKGFTKGFIAELAMLAALLLGVYISIQFSGYIPPILGITGEHSSLVAFIICFLAVIILVYLLGKWVENVAKSLSMGFFNHILGAAFGIVKTAFILSLCLYFINKIDKTHFFIKDEIREKSFLYKPIENMAPFIFHKLEIGK